MSLSRREFLELGAVAAAIIGTGGNALAKSALRATKESLYRFSALGNLTLLHLTDCHGQLLPVYFREPDTNLGVGDAKGRPPHITGKDFLNYFNLPALGPKAYAYSSEDYVKLASEFGPMGGFAHIASLVKQIRQERGEDKVLLLDSGDTWQGSYTAMTSGGEDMVQVANQLKVDAMTAHWEFTHGEAKVLENIKKLNFPFLAHNVRDVEWEDPVFKARHLFERGGTQVAVIGQAFPYTPIANPRRLIPSWSMGIQEKNVQKQVDAVKAKGAKVVVLLSHNGMDVDVKLASRVSGIDVILGGHTHDAVPKPLQIKNRGGTTLVCNSGSNGKFLSRMDLDVGSQGVKSWRYQLIPVLSNWLPADEAMSKLIKSIRDPHEKHLQEVVGVTDDLLYRRGNFNGTYDDLICQALMQEMDAEVALSPGFRWGTSLLPGQNITMDSIYTQTAISYPNVYRRDISGAQLKLILEDVADNIFNPDPYQQQGGDMVRVGGIRYDVMVNAPMGERIRQIEVAGKALDPKRNYKVSGWASMQDVDGPPIWKVVADHVRAKGRIKIKNESGVKRIL
ncbi:thiosulfohydrolase SoxB [Magnetococcales bacterium HHB-1]